MADLEARLETLKNVLPEEKDMGELLRRLQTLAVQSNLTIRTFKPSATPVAKQIHAEVPISLQLDGAYHNLAMFFDRVSKFSRIIHNQRDRHQVEGQAGAELDDHDRLRRDDVRADGEQEAGASDTRAAGGGHARGRGPAMTSRCMSATALWLALLCVGTVSAQAPTAPAKKPAPPAPVAAPPSTGKPAPAAPVAPPVASKPATVTPAVLRQTTTTAITPRDAAIRS